MAEIDEEKLAKWEEENRFETRHEVGEARLQFRIWALIAAVRGL